MGCFAVCVCARACLQEEFLHTHLDTGRLYVVLRGKGCLVTSTGHRVPLQTPCALWLPCGNAWGVHVTGKAATCLVATVFAAGDSRALITA
jgi:hypothetical protein